jgi:rhodanese-related sulfurtransferase
VFERLFSGAAKLPSLTPQEAWQRLSQKQPVSGQPTPTLIDVREPWEFNGGHAKGAHNIPLSQLGRRMSEIPADRDVLVICQSGNRSVTAAHFLQRQGITRVVNVSGGTTVWRMHGLPLEGGKR